MELSQQVSNKELSIKLRDLGVPQISEFYHTPGGHIQWRPSVGLDYYSAFSCSELGEMLPAELSQGVWYLHWCSPRGGSSWLVWYEDEDGKKMKLKGQKHEWLIMETTEANCRAKMLAYLLEQGLIKL